jgi:hypothetical protein
VKKHLPAGNRERNSGMFAMEMERTLFSKRFVFSVIGLALICILFLSDQVKLSIRWHEQREMFSSIQNIEMLLMFDRCKTLLLIVLVILCCSGFIQDLQHHYIRCILSRVSFRSYARSMTAAVVINCVCAVSMAFLLIALVLLPLMVIVVPPEFSIAAEAYQSLAEGPFAPLYLILMGANFGMAASVLVLVGLWISVWIPNLYIAAGSSVLVFYLLYAFSWWLPYFLDFDRLSSSVQVSILPPWIELPYHFLFFSLLILLTGGGFYHSFRKKVLNGQI